MPSLNPHLCGNFVLEIVVFGNTLFHNVCDGRVEEFGINGCADGAILDECTEKVVDVFLDVSEIHSIFVFCQGAKIANICESSVTAPKTARTAEYPS